jgi:hypothetical protein
MPKYVIERDLPGAGSLSADELRSIIEKSNLQSLPRVAAFQPFRCSR